MKINAKTFASKFKSKAECWNFLAYEFDAYLPAYHCVTVWHLKDLLSGKRKGKFGFNLPTIAIVLTNKACTPTTVPGYDTLSIEKILEEFARNPQIEPFLCEDRDIHRLPRAYICNVINSILPEEFNKFVVQRIEWRNEYMASTKDEEIEVDP